MQHVPVMLAETLEHLAVRPEGTYLDATAGLGGHSLAIAERLTTGRLIACDRDPESLDRARENTRPAAGRIDFVRTEFSALGEALANLGIGEIDGLVADLGVSRYQLTDAERGFSLAAPGPLDMRMDRTKPGMAAEVVNTYKERDLADLIYRLGEERRSRAIARAIVRARPIRDTGHLARVVEQAAPRTGRLHPATQTFMALRRAVNHEPEELDRLLEEGPRLLARGGRMVVISFMSLEDRQVKEKFRELARQGQVRVLTRHVVKPAEGEIETNPASRSARLRALERL
jgi:16S rRNA (cytosine1402-N4)-methyltransferase